MAYIPFPLTIYTPFAQLMGCAQSGAGARQMSIIVVVVVRATQLPCNHATGPVFLVTVAKFTPLGLCVYVHVKKGGGVGGIESPCVLQGEKVIG